MAVEELERANYEEEGVVDGVDGVLDDGVLGVEEERGAWSPKTGFGSIDDRVEPGIGDDDVATGWRST